MKLERSVAMGKSDFHGLDICVHPDAFCASSTDLPEAAMFAEDNETIYSGQQKVLPVNVTTRDQGATPCDAEEVIARTLHTIHVSHQGC